MNRGPVSIRILTKTLKMKAIHTRDRPAFRAFTNSSIWDPERLAKQKTYKSGSKKIMAGPKMTLSKYVF
jgi:hypothetical protein